MTPEEITAIVEQTIEKHNPHSPIADHWICRAEAMEICALSDGGFTEWTANGKLSAHKMGQGTMFYLSEVILAAMAFRLIKSQFGREKALERHGLTMKDISRMAKPAA